MQSDKANYIFLGIAILSLLIAAGIVFYYLHLIRRMEKILKDFKNKKVTNLKTLKETRESKLENQLYRVLSQVAQEQEKAAAERDEVAALLSDLSHQLKTPLANVLMYAELMEDENLSSQEKNAFARETRIQAGKMEWLMKDMLKASRLEQGISAFPIVYQSIKATIGRAVGAVYAQARDKGICIITEEFEDRCLYHNPKWTAEALGNVLENAVKYSPKDSVITLRMYPLEIYTRIEIEDQGPGIAPGEYNDIFKRFYRGKLVEQKEGNGLGLYLAQLILNQEKGYITVSSHVGKGCCFQIYLLNKAK